MLKETEAEKTSLFFHIFVIDDILIEGTQLLPPWLRLWLGVKLKRISCCFH